MHLVQLDRGVPRVRVLHLAVVQPQHLPGEREHARQTRFEGQVLRHQVGIHPVLRPSRLLVVVGPVPGAQRPVVPVCAEAGAERGQFAVAERLEARDEGGVEVGHRFGVLGHLDLDRVVRPARMAQQLGRALAQPEGLGEQGSVLVDGPPPVLAEQSLARLPVRGLGQERVELGIVEAHPEGPGRGTRFQPIHELVRQASQALAADLDRVLVLVDVAVERDLQLHQAGPHALQLSPRREIQQLASASKVAHPQLQDAARLDVQGLRLGRFGDRAHGLIEVLSERERGAPLREPLLGGRARVTHRRVGVGLGQEGAPPVRLAQAGTGPLQRRDPGVEGGGLGGHGLRNERVRLRQSAVGLAADGFLGDRGVVEQHAGMVPADTMGSP